MKKVIALTLAMLLILVLFTGCTKTEKAPASESGDKATSSTDTQTPADTTDDQNIEPYYVAMHIPLTGDASQYDSVLAASQIEFPQRPSVDGKSMVDITVDDATYMIMKLKNGAVGTIECSKIATGTSDELRFEIHGSKGALCYNSSTVP